MRRDCYHCYHPSLRPTETINLFLMQLMSRISTRISSPDLRKLLKTVTMVKLRTCWDVTVTKLILILSMRMATLHYKRPHWQEILILSGWWSDLEQIPDKPAEMAGPHCTLLPTLVTLRSPSTSWSTPGDEELVISQQMCHHIDT